MYSPLTNGNKLEATNLDDNNEGDHGGSNQIKINEVRNNEILEIEIPVKVPIVGFETMEERAKFTVMEKLHFRDSLNPRFTIFYRLRILFIDINVHFIGFQTTSGKGKIGRKLACFPKVHRFCKTSFQGTFNFLSVIN